MATTRNRMEMLYHLLNPEFRNKTEECLLNTGDCEWAKSIRIEPVLDKDDKLLYERNIPKYYGVYVVVPEECQTFSKLLDELNEEEKEFVGLGVKFAPKGHKLLCTLDNVYDLGLILRLNADLDSMLAFLTGYSYARLHTLNANITSYKLPTGTNFIVRVSEHFSGGESFINLEVYDNGDKVHRPIPGYGIKQKSNWVRPILYHLRTIIVECDSDEKKIDLVEPLIEGFISGANGFIELEVNNENH